MKAENSLRRKRFVVLEASVSMSPEAIIVTKASSGRLSPLNIHVLQPLDYLVHMFGTFKEVKITDEK